MSADEVKKVIFTYLKQAIEIRVRDAGHGPTCGGDMPGTLAVKVSVHLTDPDTGEHVLLAEDTATLD